jgi:hypothetical protein
MEETLSTSQRLFLSPVDRLKDLCREEHNEYPHNEFCLKKQPDSLKAFVDLSLKKNGRRSDRILWVRDGAFVRMGGVEGLPKVYRQWRLKLMLKDSRDYKHLYIHSSTLEEAISCLDFLLGLQDDRYKEIRLDYNASLENGQPPVCPLPSRVLKKLLIQNESRKNEFYKMTFTPDQCHVLAASGRRTNISFSRCRFEDGGVAFLEASAAREDDESGLAKLSIRGKLPFDERNFMLFLNQHKLECLALHYIHLRIEDACRALAEAEVQYLDLEECSLADGGATLVESV